MCVGPRKPGSSFYCPSIVAKARERLKMAAYPSVRSVSCDLEDGVLFLWGQVSTFFEKQLAQEAVFNLDGVTEIVNEIEVVGDSSSGDAAAKYRCALECSNPQQRRRWLREAADAGHIPAMCDYALVCENADKGSDCSGKRPVRVMSLPSFATLWNAPIPTNENTGWHKLPRLGMLRPRTPWPRSAKMVLKPSAGCAKPPAKVMCRQCTTMRFDVLIPRNDDDGSRGR